MKRIATTKADETPEFVEFWEIWRKHARHTDGRGDARDTFVQHLKAGAPGRDIVDGAKCFIRTMKDKDRDYIPLAASWINKRAYEDLAPQERQHQAKITEAQTRRVEQIKVAAQEPASAQIDPERRAEIAARVRSAAASMRAS